MSRPEPTTTAREELRAQLLAAARREEAKPEAVAKRRRRRRQRRGLGLGVAVLLGGAVAATATDLISTGEPVRDSGFSGEQYRPVAGAPDLVAQAKDPENATLWGVGVYESANGQSCVIAGQVRGRQLGTIRDDKFHPYREDSRGACGKLGRRPMVVDTLNVGGAAPRTIIFGRARPGEPYVLVNSGGKPRREATARGGGFILVYEGRVSDAEVNPRLPGG